MIPNSTQSYIKAQVKLADNWDAVDKALERRTSWAFRYLGGVIKNQAVRGMGKSKKVGSSRPGSPANSPPPGRILRKTIERQYLPRPTPRIRVGPKAGVGSRFKPGEGHSAPNIPALLEYGGTKRLTKPKFIPRQFATMMMLQKEKKRREKKRRKKRRPVNIRKIKTVMIPAGTYRIGPRPTMRIGFNKAILQNSPKIQRAFDIAADRDAFFNPIDIEVQARYV